MQSLPSYTLLIFLYNRTPCQTCKGRKPEVSHLDVFGCVAYVLVDAQYRKNLDDKDIKSTLIGYSILFKVYKLFNHVGGYVIISRYVVFNEDASWNYNYIVVDPNIKLA